LATAMLKAPMHTALGKPAQMNPIEALRYE
jgi:hypothetical protein